MQVFARKEMRDWALFILIIGSEVGEISAMKKVVSVQSAARRVRESGGTCAIL